MRTPLTVNDIEVLLHCHCFPVPHPRQDAPAVVRALMMWDREGMIEPYPNDQTVYRTTAKGVQFVEVFKHAPALLKAVRDLLNMVTDSRLHGPEVQAASDAIIAATKGG